MSQDATVAYLGFHEKDNLGDDAIYDAVKSQLPGVVFNDIPRLAARVRRSHPARRWSGRAGRARW